MYIYIYREGPPKQPCFLCQVERILPSYCDGKNKTERVAKSLSGDLYWLQRVAKSLGHQLESRQQLQDQYDDSDQYDDE